MQRIAVVSARAAQEIGRLPCKDNNTALRIEKHFLEAVHRHIAPIAETHYAVNTVCRNGRLTLVLRLSDYKLKNAGWRRQVERALLPNSTATEDQRSDGSAPAHAEPYS